MKRKNKARIARNAKLAQKEAAGDFSHLMGRNGEQIRKPIPQPTLPKIQLDDDERVTASSQRGAGGETNYASSYATSTAKDEYYTPHPDYPPTEYPPPMPVYDDNYYYQHPNVVPNVPGTPGGEYDDSMYDRDLRTPATEYGFNTARVSQERYGRPYDSQHQGGHAV